jgi:hypothetical protein
VVSGFFKGTIGYQLLDIFEGIITSLSYAKRLRAGPIQVDHPRPSRMMVESAHDYR